jgi:16S rRNA (uracil1498-N3)-methyltransferase
MARRRFFVDEVRRGEAELAGDDAEHLSRALRAEPGQQYEICDGARLYLAEILEAHKRSVRFRIMEELPAAAPSVRITLLMSLIKFERFEWTIEKATELGVEKIVPMRAERSEKGLELAARKRVERWRKIARAAAQQSRRIQTPVISPPLDMREAIADGENEQARRWRLEEQAGAPLIRVAAQDPKPGESIVICAGPEGGWTDRERGRFFSAQWSPVSLGPRILRAETAAIAAIALISHAWEAVE